MIDSLTYNSPCDSLPQNLATVFGESAREVAQPVEAFQSTPTLTENWVVWLGVLALFVLYLFVLFAYGGHFGQMNKIVMGRNLGIRVADELSYLFMRAVRYSVLMGFVMLSLATIKWLDVTGVKSLGIDERWLLPLFVGVFAVVYLLQRLLTRGICSLVRRNDIAEGIELLSDTLMAYAAIITTPIVLLFVANAGTSAEVLGWVCVAVVGVALLVFCTKSLIFFLEQKVSILLLILYLCTVILIPIGIVATLVVRNSAF